MIKMTATEKAKIEAVVSAIKDLPRGIYLETDDFSSSLGFWKRTPQPDVFGSAEMLYEMKSKTRFSI